MVVRRGMRFSLKGIGRRGSFPEGPSDHATRLILILF